MGNLYSRIINTIQRIKNKLFSIPAEPKIEEPEEEAAKIVKRVSYITEAGITHTIREASRHRLLIQLLYNQVWRHVEPYSFRNGKHGVLFYGHDLLRNDTRSYYIHRIQEVRPTDIPYNPRWFVEIS